MNIRLHSRFLRDVHSGVWKSRKPESGIGTGIGTGTGSGTGIGTGMGRETYIKAGTTTGSSMFRLIERFCLTQRI